MTDTPTTPQKQSARWWRRSGDDSASRRRGHKSAKGTSRRGWRARLLRWLIVYPVVLAILIALIPVSLTALYRIEGIRPASTLMVARIVTGQPMQRQWVDIEDIAPRLYQSVLMSEDGQFCFHYGVDLRELRAVIEDALDGERVRGASTITMQTAKNLFLWNDRSYIRKALEVPLALWIDLVLPKQRIMEIYLNVAEWGPDGEFGASAAAQTHFGRAPDALTSRQAALLAVTLPNPHVRNPARPSGGMNRVADVIQGRANRSGAYIRCLTE